MIDFYLDLIRRGELSLEQVPPRWYEAVKKALEA